MDQPITIGGNVQARLSHSRDVSNTGIRVAVFQFVEPNKHHFDIQTKIRCRVTFTAYYVHEGRWYKHPYVLSKDPNGTDNNIEFQCEPFQICPISLYLTLTRLRDFDVADSKRYYDAIDQSLDRNSADISDFHQVYLEMTFFCNQKLTRQWCNGYSPIPLPKFVSDVWTREKTILRFRYDTEGRNGTFPCQMKLFYDHGPSLDSYKIVLCLTSNTIPAEMDFHSIRWIRKIEPNSLARFVAPSVNDNWPIVQDTGEHQAIYALNHSTGLVMAQVSGKDLVFTPQLIETESNSSRVQTCSRPMSCGEEQRNRDIKNNEELAIVVVKESDYEKIIRERGKDKAIQPFLPFDEPRNSSKRSNSKRFKKDPEKQLKLDDEQTKPTYSQAHVRLHAAAYIDENILLTEALHPPLRNSKIFEPLRIIKVIKFQQQFDSDERIYIYCNCDNIKSKPTQNRQNECPYMIDWAFFLPTIHPSKEEVSAFFEHYKISVPANYVPECPKLLEFTVPIQPDFNGYRTFIRLRHAQSADYNPSAPALINEHWHYFTPILLPTYQNNASSLPIATSNLADNYDDRALNFMPEANGDTIASLDHLDQIGELIYQPQSSIGLYDEPWTLTLDYPSLSTPAPRHSSNHNN